MGARLVPGLAASAVLAVLFVLVPGSAPAVAAAPTCFGQTPTLTGTAADDTLQGTSGADVIVGLGGVDTIHGLGGDDLICGADDTGGAQFTGTVTADLLFGDAGDDQLRGTEDPAGRWGGWATGGPGDDTFETTGVTYADAPHGVRVDLEAGTATGRGHDTLHGVVNLRGSRYDDELTGNAVGLDEDGFCGCDHLEGLGGDDVLNGRKGWDWLLGGAGDDALHGGAGTDTLLPGRGADHVTGGKGPDDTVSYFTANAAVTLDLAAGTATGVGHDVLSGVERAIGTRFADRLIGDSGDNQLSGAAGADSIHGRGGRDTVFGDEGRDHLYGGPGHDTAVGGAGTDICYAEEIRSCEHP